MQLAFCSSLFFVYTIKVGNGCKPIVKEFIEDNVRQIDWLLPGSGTGDKKGQNAFAASLFASSQNFIEAQRRGSVKTVDLNRVCVEHDGEPCAAPK